MSTADSLMASASVFYGKAYAQREAAQSAATSAAECESAPTIAIPQSGETNDIEEEEEEEEEEKTAGSVDADADAVLGAAAVVTLADDGDMVEEFDDEWCGWRSAVDELSGMTYYYHLQLGRSSWDWPPAEGLE